MQTVSQFLKLLSREHQRYCSVKQHILTFKTNLMNEAIIAGCIIFAFLSLMFLMVYVVSIASTVGVLKKHNEELMDCVDDLKSHLDHIRSAILRTHYQTLSCTSVALENLELSHLDKENFERCAQLQGSRNGVVAAMHDMYKAIYDIE